MNIQDAVDAIQTIFKAIWDTTGFQVSYTDVPAKPPITQESWARVIVNHISGGQASLAGDIGTRRFNRNGFVQIEIFSPIGDGRTKNYELGQKVLNAYEDARNEVWFRNAHLREVGSSGGFEQTNIIVRFQYDEVR